MGDKKTATIYDVASETGLAASTISKIINHKGNYPKETIDKVFSTIERLGYVPNIKARRLAEKSTQTLGVCFSSVQNDSNTHLTNVLSGISGKAFQYGYNITLFNDRFLNSEQMLSKIHEFDGIIFPVVSSDVMDYMAYLEQKEKPFVYAGSRRLFDRKGRNFYGGYYDYIHTVLEIFYQKNRRHLVFFPLLLYSDSHKYHQEQIQAVIDKFIQKHHLPSHFCILDEFVNENPTALIPVLDSYIHSDRRPDALYFNSIAATVTAYNYLQQQGLRIPEDIAVMSTGQTSLEGLEFSPPLSTIYVHAYEMGQIAVELLMNQIKPEEFPAVDNNVPYTFIEREST